ncbi:MAG: glycoside hydrolase family 2 TIM barrel-domain containing protein, partial [Candidatus Hermodarchaeota archaeon]
STGNEIPITEKACLQFMTLLLRYSRSLDDTRLISCVLEFWTALVLPTVFAQEVDVLCCNEYLGWYYLSAYNLNLFMDVLYQRTKKPWFITEFGAGAKYGFHDLAQIPDKYSEERQSSILGHSIKVFNSKNYVAGWFIWIYRDFRSHKRLNKFQEGFNRKGIVSEKNQRKMIARSMPTLVNQELENITRHNVANLILYAVLYPLIRSASIIIALVLTKFSDSGDKYYLRKPESES